jgi:hypothetical protein
VSGMPGHIRGRSEGSQGLEVGGRGADVHAHSGRQGTRLVNKLKVCVCVCVLVRL